MKTDSIDTSRKPGTGTRFEASPGMGCWPVVNEFCDYGFYRLPSLISRQSFDFDQLRATLKKILTGELETFDGDERRALIKQYLVTQHALLAYKRMVDILE